jgi:translocation and assembly module TamA
VKPPAKHRTRSIFLVALLLGAPAALAERVRVEIEGLDGDMLESARATVELRQYEDRDVSPVELRRLFERADEQIRTSLEPFGYYEARVQGRLEKAEDGVYRAHFNVTRGEPVIVREASVVVAPDEAAEIETVDLALENFHPKQGEPLDHAAYERSKQEIATALANDGYLKAQPVRRRVEVVRAAKTAEIDLAWDAGVRHRLGPVRFTESQFPDKFVQRYVPWREGEFYSAEKLLALQQTLVDADYFASVAVAPDLEHARDAVVPVDVLLLPAKRTVYTANVYVSTDTGPGTRVGAERRWINKRGHKLEANAEYSQRLEEISTQYRIPKPGLRNRNLTFGAAYRDEETDTSTSRMARFAATEVTDRWKGFQRTIGLQYLNGDFEIADQQRSTSLLYADGLLVRKKANDLYFPQSGYSLLYGLRLAAEALASDTTLAQIRTEAKWLQQVGEDGRVIVRGALGAMAVDDFDALPPELRFFAGGDRSVRGFDYQQIGELDENGGVIGGEYLAVGSVEYEHYFLKNWGAAIFVDAGDAFTNEFDTNAGTGIGVRWKSPIGLVRLDVARPVISDFDHKWRVHLTIGPDL